MRDKMMKYEHYIDQLVAENQIDIDEILMIKNGEKITIKDFVEKTKGMPPWHRRLLGNFAEIQGIHGDIKVYMRSYVDEKMNDGFQFKK